ncbi:hypothetical protein ACLKA7_010210 [Drosophila subpalustris]
MPLAKMDSFVKFFYKALGIKTYRVSRPSVSSIWNSIIFWANMINLSVVMFAEVVYVLMAFALGKNIVEAIMVMSYIGFIFVGMSKMAFVWWKKTALNGITADASTGIALAVYNQNWSYADVRYRRALAFIISRSQKPVFLKATVFLHITRVTMTELLQLSYKFFALLRTMYAK